MSLKASGVNVTVFGTTVTIESIAIPTTALAILAAAAVIFIYLQNRTAPVSSGRPVRPPSQSSSPSPPPRLFSSSSSRPSPCSFSSTTSDPSSPPTIPPRPFPPPPPPLPPRRPAFVQKHPRTADEQKEQNPWPKQPEGSSRHRGGSNKSEQHADQFTGELKRKITPYYKT